MTTNTFNTDGLSEFGTLEQQSLLDEIDSLRMQGASEFVFLPQIVVCGNQSSGKSSVLEALSGVPFPRSDTLCTCFPTEVVLRKSNVIEVVVSIVPGADVSDPDRARLAGFQQNLLGLEAFPDLIERAKAEMGITAEKRAFASSFLRVGISGPRQPTLTVVDLPGLIQTDSKEQSTTDVNLINNMVTSYMKNPRSVILAVVSAKDDYANQGVLFKSREIDPDGQRTLGLITKPDEVREGSGMEQDFLNLAGNSNIVFRLGWHVVRNRDYKERDFSTEERDLAEESFFSQGAWKDLPRDMLGISSLRLRLCKVLMEQIKKYLPKLTEDLQVSLDDCKTKLQKLGESRSTPDEQRRFLIKLSESFQTLCRAALDEIMNTPFLTILAPIKVTPIVCGSCYKIVIENLPKPCAR